MSIDRLFLVSQNITLLYDTLDLSSINTSRLKNLIGIPPTIMDTPEMIVSVYPGVPLIIQFGDRRIRLTLQGVKQDLETIGTFGDSHLAKIAITCNLLAQSSQMIAFGYNYDLEVHVSDSRGQKDVINLFISDIAKIEDILHGDLVSFVPRLKFQREETFYDLIIDPIDEQRIKVHLNAHFESAALPKQKQFERAFQTHFDYLRATLLALFVEVAN